MAENHGPTESGKTGRGKRSSAVLPTVLPAHGPPIAPAVKREGGGQQHTGGREENPYWRDRAEQILAALAEFAGSNQPEAIPNAQARGSGNADAAPTATGEIGEKHV